MLKQEVADARNRAQRQPPSGGCVLKPCYRYSCRCSRIPAAFGRLCVETIKPVGRKLYEWPAAFGRLCVETDFEEAINAGLEPAAFGRLCVETI